MSLGVSVWGDFWLGVRRSQTQCLEGFPLLVYATKKSPLNKTKHHKKNEMSPIQPSSTEKS